MNKQELRYDILKELFNISIGKAASMLSEIVNRKILLSIPNIKVINLKYERPYLYNYIPREIDGTLMVSSISFEEKLTGKANLIFPAEKMRTFINLCVHENEDSTYCDMNFTSIDFDIIKEVGNIILNSIIGEVANYLDTNLKYTLPEVKIFNKIDFSKDIKNSDCMHALILYITFIIDETEIAGAIIIDLNLNSLNKLMKKVDDIGADLYG